LTGLKAITPKQPKNVSKILNFD